MAARFFPTASLSLLTFITFALLIQQTTAFGAGYVTRGSAQQGTAFRHGDVLLAVPFMASANRRLVKKIYFGNWLRDFSQLLDTKSLALVPEPILRALVAVFGILQFGYSTKEFEVTQERLGVYHPREHIDNPKTVDGDVDLAPDRPRSSRPEEDHIDHATGMKKYIVGTLQDSAAAASPSTTTTADFIEHNLVAAITCGRSENPDAYVHLGAALHTLEDFAAHSNYVELCMRLIGHGEHAHDETSETPELRVPALGRVFPFVGDGVKVNTRHGSVAPIVTGTFGSLDLYQTLLGEIDDRLSAFTLSGIKARTSDGGALQNVTKMLLSQLKKLDAPFEKDVLNVKKMANDSKPADWGKLQEAPDLLWSSIEPVFRLRDNIVRWTYDHLAVPAVQNAIAAVSTAVDRLVFMVLGIFLRPVLTEISQALQQQEQELLAQDRRMRAAQGEKSIFESGSTASDPTHSQLAKDHYDHELNELAGRVATVITTYTIEQVASIWQHAYHSNVPHSSQDIRNCLDNILSALHHPYNKSRDNPSEVQARMFNEVFTYCSDRVRENPKGFDAMLVRLDREHMAQREGEGAGHSHLHQTAPSSTQDPSSAPVANDRSYLPPYLIDRLTYNLERASQEGAIAPLGTDGLAGIKRALHLQPSDEAPNPLDAALSSLGGAGLMAAFRGIGTEEIATMPGIGELLRDGVIMMRVMEEEERELQGDGSMVGASGGGEWDRRRCKEMLELLDVERGVEDKGEEEEAKETKMGKLMGKLKMNK